MTQVDVVLTSGERIVAPFATDEAAQEFLQGIREGTQHSEATIWCKRTEGMLAMFSVSAIAFVGLTKLEEEAS